MLSMHCMGAARTANDEVRAVVLLVVVLLVVVRIIMLRRSLCVSIGPLSNQPAVDIMGIIKVLIGQGGGIPDRQQVDRRVLKEERCVCVTK